MAPTDPPTRRLNALLGTLAPPAPPLGTITLGDITYDVQPSSSPSRLPHTSNALDIHDPANLHFLLQKHLLGQDVFIVSQPGPYARRLAMSFAQMINVEYEYISLHRDVGETELKQGREIRATGLVYVDSPAVRAAKHGRILILEGIEKAERGIMPVLNNLLENREMNLDDGTHIIHPHRYALIDAQKEHLIPAHKNFRVIAIGAPVPPYPGFPLDPPFRSRFQARFIDPLSAMLTLARPEAEPNSQLYTKLRELILSTQYSHETKHALEVLAKGSSLVPTFPQTALAKLKALITMFPPMGNLTPAQLARVLLTIHPALAHASFEAWVVLSRQTEELGLGPASFEYDDTGLLGYTLDKIERIDDKRAEVSFGPIRCTVPAGPNEFLPYPLESCIGLHPTPRFVGLLTSFMQAHALGWDISLVPPAKPSTASCSTSTLVRTFGQVLGYETEVVHMYKELGGRELVMRRRIGDGGVTSWEASPLIEAAWNGRLAHLSGLDVIGPTGGALARILQDREIELWEGKRIVADASDEELTSGELSLAHPSFRVISTASKSLPLKDWLSDEHCNMFFPIPSQPMSQAEERAILLSTQCPEMIVDKVLEFARRYRETISVDNVQKNRKLGTRTLVRVCRRMVTMKGDESELGKVLCAALLKDFLPTSEKMSLEGLMDEMGLGLGGKKFYPTVIVDVNSRALVFPSPSSNGSEALAVEIPLFDCTQDEEGAQTLIPHMDHYYDNSLQTGLMRDLAVDMELMGEHLVVLGNQGVGKNKILDRLCQLLHRPREYVQLHRDTTVNQLMFTTSLENGVLTYRDSPLLRAIIHGRVIIIDEADKAPEHVVAIFRSLAGQGEMTLSDGRRVCKEKGMRKGDVVVHKNFRLVMLANRPGYPFLGNHFLQVLGENFSAHSVPNPDQASERKLLEQLAPELEKDVILRLVGAFHDLRVGYESGELGYPYSLRELINLVRHMQAYPKDDLGDALRNVFDFDIYKPETIDKLGEILIKHGLRVPHLGLDATREGVKKIEDAQFEPTATGLSEPKEGVHDHEEHSGGNTYAGGTGGRDTAGIGGRGGYKRLWKGSDIKQVPDALKDDVPEHIKARAREMAKEELARRLKELDMNMGDAKAYNNILKVTSAHMVGLFDLLEHLAAKEEERVWVRRQTDGELDDSRLTEGLIGDATVYKRRGMEKPELGRPQIKPKRIRFIFDLSASMYRFQYDGRLKRSQETAVMLMETFANLSRKDKYVWDMYGHSGDGPEIPLVEVDKYPTTIKERWKVIEKMEMIPQYAFAGDYTVEAIEKGVQTVAKYDADDWFVITITDANFGRYSITPEDILRAMKKNSKVNTALICIGEGAEAPWVMKRLPGQGFSVMNTGDIPAVLRSILAGMVER